MPFRLIRPGLIFGLVADFPAILVQALQDRYRIERELGRGGMATVYLVRDLKHERPVALKVLHAELAQALGVERFQREIRLAARLQHPHILTVHDSGDAGGLLWFTMPYIEGQSLRARLERERQLPVADAVRIVTEAARALDHAHREGVVHRDIKPENILLTTEGDTLVADFGIARALTGADDRVTGTGLAIGTPAYMSPEQASGEAALDPRTDVYSLTAVLYELLAGEPPFTGPTAQAVIAKRFQGNAPRIREVRPSVPPALEALIERGLAPVPADRFATTGELARALQGAVEAPGATVRASGASLRSKRMFRFAVGAGFVAVLALGAVFVRGLRGGGAPTPAAERSLRIAVLPFENQGEPSDAYFAEGVSDAIRGKLIGFVGLEVIARASSQYQAVVLSPKQIAEELDVDFLLTGTVRWARQPDGSSRVQVNPELIEIADGRDRSRWQQPFDAPLTDVFQVQGEIAGRVAEALHLALSTAEQRELVVQPTADLAAYDLYLKGGAIIGNDWSSIQRSIEYYRQAVARDSTFGEAWAALAFRILALYPLEVQGEDSAKIRDALARAMRFAPTSSLTYRARLADMNSRLDYAAATEIVKEGMIRHGADADFLRLAGRILFNAGRAEEGLAMAERAHLLDPRSVRSARSLATLYFALRRPADALRILRRAQLVAPSNGEVLQYLVRSHLGLGDLEQARQVVADAPPDTDRQLLFAQLAMYDDLYWVLTPGQQDTVMTAPVALFDNDSGSRALAFAEIFAQRRDSAAVVRWAAEAARHFAVRADRASTDPQFRALQALALAYVGRRSEAIRVIEAAPRLTATEDLVMGDYIALIRARIAVLAGKPSEAIDLLVETYGRPQSWIIGAPALRFDPVFLPLHGHPRFDSLTTPR